MCNHYISCSPFPESIKLTLWFLCVLCRFIQLAPRVKINLFGGAELGLLNKLPAKEQYKENARIA